MAEDYSRIWDNETPKETPICTANRRRPDRGITTPPAPAASAQSVSENATRATRIDGDELKFLEWARPPPPRPEKFPEEGGELVQNITAGGVFSQFYRMFLSNESRIMV